VTRRRAADRPTELLLAARSDPRAFGEFFELVNDDLLAYFYRRCFDAHAANDLAQETLAKVLAGIDGFDPAQGEARQWVWGIARRQLAEWFKKGRAETRAREQLGLPLRPLPDEALEYVETLVDLAPMMRRVNEALSLLSDNVRDCVHLRVELGLSYDEIAARVDCTPGAARVRVSRGLAQLEGLLADADSEVVST
jgi:RNA polymerase sigma factor (sigma-70 family)